MNEPPVKEAFYLLCELAMKLRIAPLNQLEGCWEHRIDKSWFVAMNGHDVPKPVIGVPGGMAHLAGEPFMLDPFHAYVEYNGWTAAVFHVTGGGTFAAGSEANEDTFIAAVRAAIEKE